MMRKMMREGKGWTDGSQESVVECFTPMQPGDESLTPPLLLGGEKIKIFLSSLCGCGDLPAQGRTLTGKMTQEDRDPLFHLFLVRVWRGGLQNRHQASGGWGCV
jgi:hypothetical protein